MIWRFYFIVLPLQLLVTIKFYGKFSQSCQRNAAKFCSKSFPHLMSYWVLVILKQQIIGHAAQQYNVSNKVLLALTIEGCNFDRIIGIFTFWSFHFGQGFLNLLFFQNHFDISMSNIVIIDVKFVTRFRSKIMCFEAILLNNRENT